MGGVLGEVLGDGGKNTGVSELFFFLQGAEPLQIDPRAVAVEPVQDFIEETGVVAGDGGRKEEQRLGIDEPGVIGPGVPGDAQGRPLPPQKFEESLDELGSKVGQ